MIIYTTNGTLIPVLVIKKLAILLNIFFPVINKIQFSGLKTEHKPVLKRIDQYTVQKASAGFKSFKRTMECKSVIRFQQRIDPC